MFKKPTKRYLDSIKPVVKLTGLAKEIQDEINREIIRIILKNVQSM